MGIKCSRETSTEETFESLDYKEEDHFKVDLRETECGVHCFQLAQDMDQ